MNISNILSDKLATAVLPEICAPRRALLELFDKEAGKRVFFVSAPAGYGKSVSTLLWLQSSGKEVIWIRLDSYDNSPSIFYKLFCAGILSAQPENKAMVDILQSPSFASSPVEHTISLLSEFIPDGKQYALVLDDMHLVTNGEIRKSGLLVQRRLPLSFTTLILTRNEIAEEYQEMAGRGRTAVITARDLAFSPEEIQKYFGEYGHFITTEEAESIYAITNGWSIGVNALAMSGQTRSGQSGGRILGDYIKKQIWDKWSEDLRQFMLKTCIAEELTAGLCEKLTGREDGKDILDSLCRSNSFISKTHEGTYRYHHLFSEFLRNQIQETKFDAKQLHRLAAEHYLEQGEYYMARRHAVESKDADMIERMMYGFGQYTNPSLVEYVNFSKTFNQDALPEYFCDRYPFLYSAHIWFSYLCGKAREMEYYLGKLYRNLPVIAEKFPQFLESSYLLISLDHRTPFSAQIEQFKQLPPIANINDTPQGASITMQMPFFHRSNRDYYEAADKKLMAKAKETFGPFLKEKSELLFACASTGLLLEQNKLNEVPEKELTDEGLINKDTSPEIVFSVYLHLAAVYLAKRDKEHFDEMMDTVEDYLKNTGAQYLNPNFIAYKTKIMLFDADGATAKAWLETYCVTEGDHLELYKIFQHFTTARSYITLAQTDKAMNYILKLKQLGEDFRRLLDIAEASILQAALEWALGNTKEAQDTLESALASIQEYGFIRVVADEGAAVLPILKKLASKIQKEGYRGNLDARYLNEVAIAAYEQSRRYKGITANIIDRKPIKLSKQQKRIISLLAKGYKNAEIVELTGLSIHTVKSHCAAAYIKLGVNNAMDAVMKARELRLIG